MDRRINQISEKKTDGLCIHFRKAMFPLIYCIFTWLVASSLVTKLPV
jgi:hypothetical protein